MRVKRAARIRRSNQGKIRRHRIIVVLTISAVATVSGSLVVSASTLDDIRDLYGKSRLDAKYTDLDKREIWLQWSRVNNHNNVAKMFSIDDSLAMLEVTDESIALTSTMNKGARSLKDSFLNGGSVPQVLQYKTEVENLAYSLSRLKQKGDVIELDLMTNDWDAKLKEMETVIAEVNTYRDLGDVASELQSPVRGHFFITSLYGFRVHPLEGEWKAHAGLDLVAPVGTDILSVWGGVVSRVYTSEKGGNTVEVQHDDGLYTRYLHMQEISVKEGQVLKQYDVVGKLGGTGAVTGAHLHFEVHLDGESVNPIYFFGKMGENALKDYLSNNPSERDADMENLLNSIKFQPTWVKDIIDTEGSFDSDIVFRKFGVAPKGADDLVLAEGYEAPKPSTNMFDAESPLSGHVKEPNVVKKRETPVYEEEVKKEDGITNTNLPNASSMRELLGLLETSPKK